MSYILIKFTDGTEQKEYCWADGGYRVKDGLLIISKGRYDHALNINMETVKQFQEVDR